MMSVLWLYSVVYRSCVLASAPAIPFDQRGWCSTARVHVVVFLLRSFSSHCCCGLPFLHPPVTVVQFEFKNIMCHCPSWVDQ